MNGTAPGWWLERSDGGLIVALPGPPREMRPMWADGVMPRLRERGLGVERATRTLRLWGIGESQAADLLGEELLRASNPVVATYARTDSVDVRISAVADAGRPARTIADDTERRVLDALDEYVWGRDDETWPAAIGRRFGRSRGRPVSGGSSRAAALPLERRARRGSHRPCVGLRELPHGPRQSVWFCASDGQPSWRSRFVAALMSAR